MFGLPQDIFGEGPFGVTDWAPLAIYNSVPLAHRTLDAEQGYPLRKFFAAMQGESTDILAAISELLEQRQPLLARDGAARPIVAITSTAIGAQTTITTVTPHGFGVGESVVFAGAEFTTPPIRGVQSVAQVLSPTQFVIDFATTLGSTPGYVQSYNRASVPVWVADAEVVIDPDYGQTTNFTFEYGTNLDYLGVGYKAVLSAGGIDYTYEVARLRTRNADDSPTTRNGALCYGILLPPTTTITPPYLLRFEQPSTLQYLTSDFGLIYDSNDPTFFRRSLVRNVAQYVVQKASQKGYQIRSVVAGFNVTAQSLYALCSDVAPTGLPSGSVFYYDGTYYTTIPPKRFRLDLFPADIEWTDPESGASVFPLDEFLYGDASADDLSPAAAVSQCLTDYYVGSSGTLPVAISDAISSPATLAAYSLPYGHDVVVQFASLADFLSFSAVSAGAFALRGPSGAVPEEDYFIEALLAWDAFTLQATFLVGVPAATPVPLGSYCILYYPQADVDCCYCKSYHIRLVANPTATLYADLGGSGALVNAALDRLVTKLRREQLPVHADFADVVLEVVAAAAWQPSVSITVT